MERPLLVDIVEKVENCDAEVHRRARQCRATVHRFREVDFAEPSDGQGNASKITFDDDGSYVVTARFLLSAWIHRAYRHQNKAVEASAVTT
jgi:hypothetical protein